MLLLRLNLYETNVNLYVLYVERASVALTNSIAAASLTATISLVAAKQSSPIAFASPAAVSAAAVAFSRLPSSTAG